MRPEVPQLPARDDDENRAEKIDLNNLTDEQVDDAYQYVFFFYEVHGSLVLKENELLREIQRCRDMKELLDQKIRTLKASTRSPGSDNIKRIKGAERRIDELHNTINQLELDLTATRLEQSASEAKYKWYASIVDEDVVKDREGLMFGLLGHVFRQK